MSVTITTPMRRRSGTNIQPWINQAKEHTAQESSPPCRFNDKGVGPRTAAPPEHSPPGAIPFPALKTGCRLRTPRHRKSWKPLRTQKGHSNRNLQESPRLSDRRESL